MPKPFPKEFRDDVVRVAQNRDPDVTLAQIAKDFGGIPAGTVLSFPVAGTPDARMMVPIEPT